MYRGNSKQPLEDIKGHGKKNKKLKRWAIGEHPPMTALEYFIYTCTVLFVGVFAIMQGVFLYKLHLYEATIEGGAAVGNTNSSSDNVRMLNQDKQLAIQPRVMSNKQKIEMMAMETQREFTRWPPLDAVIDERDGRVIGNPQFLLDFAVIGFEKAGKLVLLLKPQMNN